jgi:hypothetical protein
MHPQRRGHVEIRIRVVDLVHAPEREDRVHRPVRCVFRQIERQNRDHKSSRERFPGPVQ